MVVPYRNGCAGPPRAARDVVDGAEDPHTGSWYYTQRSEQRAITLGIQRQPGTNTIAVADAVKNLLPQFQAELPPASTWTCSTTGRTPSASRTATCSSRWC
jgi:HAE1 family hydrophobic/amphiphilic exporter-1